MTPYSKTTEYRRDYLAMYAVPKGHDGRLARLGRSIVTLRPGETGEFPVERDWSMRALTAAHTYAKRAGFQIKARRSPERTVLIVTRKIDTNPIRKWERVNAVPQKPHCKSPLLPMFREVMIMHPDDKPIRMECPTKYDARKTANSLRGYCNQRERLISCNVRAEGGMFALYVTVR